MIKKLSQWTRGICSSCLFSINSIKRLHPLRVHPNKTFKKELQQKKKPIYFITKAIPNKDNERSSSMKQPLLPKGSTKDDLKSEITIFWSIQQFLNTMHKLSGKLLRDKLNVAQFKGHTICKNKGNLNNKLNSYICQFYLLPPSQ